MRLPVTRRSASHPQVGSTVSESHQGMVQDSFALPALLASSEICETQIYRYADEPWYTFQGHIERGWESACPEAYLLWKNMLRNWGLAPWGAVSQGGGAQATGAAVR